MQVALIIDTLKPGFVIASTIRHSCSALALPEYMYPSSNMLSPQTSPQSSYFNPILHKASEDR